MAGMNSIDADAAEKSGSARIRNGNRHARGFRIPSAALIRPFPRDPRQRFFLRA
jgi:hypothetical protein